MIFLLKHRNQLFNILLKFIECILCLLNIGKVLYIFLSPPSKKFDLRMLFQPRNFYFWFSGGQRYHLTAFGVLTVTSSLPDKAKPAFIPAGLPALEREQLLFFIRVAQQYRVVRQLGEAGNDLVIIRSRVEIF